MTLIHNERTKLLANALDRASTACVAVGFIGPAASIANPMSAVLSASLGSTIATVIWLFAAVALHLLARRVLGGLRA